MKDIDFRPYLEKYKTPVGALNSLEEAFLNIYLKDNYNIYDFNLVIYNDNGEVCKKKMIFLNDENSYHHYNVSFSLDGGYIYWYYFEFSDCYGKHFIDCNADLEGFLTDSNVHGFQVNVQKNNNKNLEWFMGKVMYQILVDRFYKGGTNPIKESGFIHSSWNSDVCYEPINGKYNEDFFGGDLQGIIAKLPYLKSLNVGIIYLNPIFLSPTSHKYNISDYMMIDPMYGTEETFKSLCQKANELGIYIILDGVFNHTGDDSIYFNKYNHFNNLGAYQSKKSKFYNWYDFIDYPTDYRSWWGIKTLPAVNQNSDFVDFITGNNGVIDKWMGCGAKGFRLDVVDELNGNFVEKINDAITRNDSNGICLGEVWEDASNKISYSKRRTYFNGSELDSVMNYPLKDAIISYLNNNKIKDVVNCLRNEVNNYSSKVLNSLMNILSTHDTERIITSFSQVKSNVLSKAQKAIFHMNKDDYYQARNKLLMAYTILYTVPGVPCVFYGDETGLEGYRDPFCRRTLQWDKIDEEIYQYITKLGQMRKDTIFSEGKYEEISFNDNIFIYSRFNNKDKYIIIINNSNGDYIYQTSYPCFDIINKLTFINEITINSKSTKIIKKL